MNTVTNNTATTAAEILESVLWDIRNIEALNEEQTTRIASAMEIINGHNVYYVDFPGYFGFSALVFAEGHHIHYANEYQLHHSYIGNDREKLLEVYRRNLKSKLYTDEQLTERLTTYDNFTSRAEYLHNYYPMRRDHVSAFYIGKNPPDTTGMVFCHNAFAYFKPQDVDFVLHINALNDKLTTMFDAAMLDYDFAKSAFLYEMYNHEYAINWDGDWDVIQCFANVAYCEEDSVPAMLNKAGFTELQKQAYYAAAAECRKHSNY